MQLIGKKATFIPSCMTEKKSGNPVDWCRDVNVTGVIDYVNEDHGWFSVRYDAGGTVQRESFLFYDIDRKVTVHGKNRTD